MNFHRKAGLMAVLSAAGMIVLTGAAAHASTITLIGGAINDGNFDGTSSSSTSDTALKTYTSGNGYPTYSTLYADGTTTENTNGNIAALGSPEWTGTTSGGHLGFVNYSGASESSPNVYLANNGFAGTLTSTSSLGYTVNAGDVFTLSIDISGNTTESNDGTVTPTLNFASKAEALSASELSTTKGTYQTISYTYTATAADAGLISGISFYIHNTSGNVQLYADNAALAVTPVPAPASLELLGVGALGLLAIGSIRRRRA